MIALRVAELLDVLGDVAVNTVWSPEYKTLEYAPYLTDTTISDDPNEHHVIKRGGKHDINYIAHNIFCDLSKQDLEIARKLIDYCITSCELIKLTIDKLEAK